MSAIKRHTLKPLAAGIRYARWPLASWAALAFLPGVASAGPQGEQVAGGIVNVTRPNANTTRIQQGSDKAIVNWNSFSVGGQEYVQFVQPGSTSAILNRVVGGQESQILGQIAANGRVFLVNPQGVYFGPGAKVDAAGLAASTLDIADGDFMAGRYVFAKQAGAGDAEVRNAGEIHTDQYAVLIGDRAANEGLVEARLGTVVLAAGSRVSLQLDNSGLVNFSVDEKTLAAQAGVENAGELLAHGGRVMMTAKVAADLVATAVNNSGVVRATGIEEDGGAIVLRGSGGDVVNTGVVDASGANGGRVALVSDENVTVAAGAQVLATGEGAGQGGVVRLIADQNLEIRTGATVRATGGAAGGQGGFVEVSAIKGTLKVDYAGVDPGQGGALLIDPAKLRIDPGSSGSIWYGGASSAFVGKGFIESKLNAGIDVLLVATDEVNAGTGVTSITSTNPGGDLKIATGTVSGFSSAAFFSDTGSGLPVVTLSTSGKIRLNSVDISIAGTFVASAGSTDGELQIGDVTAHSISLTAGPSGLVNVGNLTAAPTTTGLINLSAGMVTAEVVNGGAVTVNGGGGMPAGAITLGKVGQPDGVVAQAGSVAIAGTTINITGNVRATNAGHAEIALGATSGSVTVTGGLFVNAGEDADIVLGGFSSRLNSVSISGDVQATGTVATSGLASEIEIYAHDISLGNDVLATMHGSTGASSEAPVPGAFITLQGGFNGLGGVSVAGNVKAETDAVHGLLAGVDIETLDARTLTAAIDIGGNVQVLAGENANGFVGAGGPIAVLGKVRLASLATGLPPAGTVDVGGFIKAVGHDGAEIELKGGDVVSGALIASTRNLSSPPSGLGTVKVAVLAANTATLGAVTVEGGASGKFAVQRADLITPLGGAMNIGAVNVSGANSADILLKGRSAMLGSLTATGAYASVLVRTNDGIAVTGSVTANGGGGGALVDLGQSSSGASLVNVTGSITAQANGGMAKINLAGAHAGLTVLGDVLTTNTAGDASIEVTNFGGTVTLNGLVRAEGLGSSNSANIGITNSTGAVLVGGELRATAGATGAMSSYGGSSASIDIDADRIRVGNGVLAEVKSPNVGNDVRVTFAAAGASLTTGQKAIEVAAGGVQTLNGSSASISLSSNSLNPLSGGISVTGTVRVAAASIGLAGARNDDARILIDTQNGPIRIAGDLSATAGSSASVDVVANKGGITVTGTTTVTGQSSAYLNLDALNGGGVTLGNVTVTAVNGSASAEIGAAADLSGNGGAITVNGSVTVNAGGSSGSLTLQGNTINVTGNLTAIGNSDGDASINLYANKGITIGGNVLARQLGTSDASIYIRNFNSGTINITGRVEADAGSDANVDIKGQRINLDGALKLVARSGGSADVRIEGMTGVRVGNVAVLADSGIASVSVLNGYSTAISSAVASGSGDLIFTGGISAIAKSFTTVEARNEFGALNVGGPVVARRGVNPNANPSTSAFVSLLLQGLTTTLNGTVTVDSAVGPANATLLASSGPVYPPINGGLLTLNGAVLARAAAGPATVALYGGGMNINAPVTAQALTLPSQIFAAFDKGTLQTSGNGLLVADNLYLTALGTSLGVDIATSAGDIYLSNVFSEPPSPPAPPTARKTINLSLDNSASTQAARLHTNTQVTFDSAGNPTVLGIAFNDARFRSNRTLIFDTQLAARRLAVNVANGAARFDQPVLIGDGALPASFGDAVSLTRLKEAAVAAGKNVPVPQFNGAPTFGPNAFFAARSGLTFAGGLTFNDPDVPYVTFLTDASLDLGPGVFSINPLKQDFLAQFTSYTPGKTVHIENTLPATLDGLGPYFTNDLHFKKLPGTTLLFGGALGPLGGTQTPGIGPILIGQNGALNVGGQNAFFVTNGTVTGAGNLVSNGFVGVSLPPVPPPPPITDDAPDFVDQLISEIEGSLTEPGEDPAGDRVDEREREKDKDKKRGDVDVADAGDGDTDGAVARKSNTGQMCE